MSGGMWFERNASLQSAAQPAGGLDQTAASEPAWQEGLPYDLFFFGFASFRMQPQSRTLFRKPLICLGTTDYAAVFADAHEDNPDFQIDGFLSYDGGAPDNILGVPVRHAEELSQLTDSHWVTCVVGTTLRRAWIEEIAGQGMRFARLVHPSAVVSQRAQLGEGVTIDPMTVVAAFTRIADHVRIGRVCSIGHHIEIGGFSTIHPGVTISGRSRIGEQVTIGTGATVLNDIEIGDGAVIAAGSVVGAKVPAGALVRGSPARVIKEGYGPR